MRCSVEKFGFGETLKVFVDSVGGVLQVEYSGYFAG